MPRVTLNSNGKEYIITDQDLKLWQDKNVPFKLLDKAEKPEVLKKIIKEKPEGEE